MDFINTLCYISPFEKIHNLDMIQTENEFHKKSQQ